MGSRWKSYGAIKSRLKQADTKLSTAHRTILQEDKAIRESPGEYDPGSDFQTEADRIKSARADIDEALRMIKADCAQGGNAATKIRGMPVSKKELEAFMKYLNDHKVESYTKTDVENFLNTYSSGNIG